LTMCTRRSSIVSAEMCAPLAQTRDMGGVSRHCGHDGRRDALINR
jgi:hypothetical protein